MYRGEVSGYKAVPLQKGLTDNSPPTDTSRLSVCFTRKAYSILLGDLCSPWAVWTVIDFALLVSDDGTIGSGRTAQKLRESKRHQKNMTT